MLQNKLWVASNFGERHNEHIKHIQMLESWRTRTTKGASSHIPRVSRVAEFRDCSKHNFLNRALNCKLFFFFLKRTLWYPLVCSLVSICVWVTVLSSNNHKRRTRIHRIKRCQCRWGNFTPDVSFLNRLFAFQIITSLSKSFISHRSPKDLFPGSPFWPHHLFGES